MPRGSLFSGISEGIFGRLNELTDEQKKRDDEKRGQVLNVLTSLIDKVEPESQGVLLGHIGATMGLKGKERGLWDRLTGRGMDATEQALGSKLSEVLGGFVGPESVRKARSMATFTKGFTPGTPEQASNIAGYQQAAQFPGKMIMRDPRAERLEDIKTQYGLKFQQQESMLQEREALLRQRQKEDDERGFANAIKIAQERNRLKVTQTANELANAYLGSGKASTGAEALQMANQAIVGKTDLELDKLREQIPLIRAQANLARTEAEGLSEGETMTPGQSRQETANRAIQGEVQKQFGEYTLAKNEVQAKQRAYESLVGRLGEIARQNGVEYDRSINDFRGDEKGVFMAQFSARQSKLVQQAQQLTSDLTAANGKMAASYDTLTRIYGPYINIDPTTGALTPKVPITAPRKQGPAAYEPKRAPLPQAGAPAQQQGAPPPLTIPLGQKKPGVQLPNPQLGPTPIPRAGRTGPETTLAPRAGGTMMFEVDGPEMTPGEQFGGNGSPRYEVIEATGKRGKGGNPIYRLRRVQ